MESDSHYLCERCERMFEGARGESTPPCQCPHGDGNCIPGDVAWQCHECEKERKPVSSLVNQDRLFVYGTLLTGSSNGGWLGVNRQPARVHGRLHYAGKYNRAFPVLVPDDDQWVLGELVTGDLFSKDWQDVISMETGVGYDVRHALVECFADTTKPTVQALVFTWPWSEYGEAVPQNDWARRYNPRKEMPWDAKN